MSWTTASSLSDRLTHPATRVNLLGLLGISARRLAIPTKKNVAYSAILEKCAACYNLTLINYISYEHISTLFLNYSLKNVSKKIVCARFFLLVNNNTISRDRDRFT